MSPKYLLIWGNATAAYPDATTDKSKNLAQLGSDENNGFEREGLGCRLYHQDPLDPELPEES
jgi:hypothetical protein